MELNTALAGQAKLNLLKSASPFSYLVTGAVKALGVIYFDDGNEF